MRWPLQGLQNVIGVSVTHPTWQRTRPDSADDKHTGWAFVAAEDPPLSSSTGEQGRSQQVCQQQVCVCHSISCQCSDF